MMTRMGVGTINLFVVLSFPFVMTTTATGWMWTKVTPSTPKTTTTITTNPPPEGTTSFSPPKVSGHVAVSTAPLLLLHNNKNNNNRNKHSSSVFLFGGLTGPAGSPTTNDLYEYNNNNNNDDDENDNDHTGWWWKHDHNINRRMDDGDNDQKEIQPRQRMYSAASILLEGDDVTEEVTTTATIKSSSSLSSSGASMYIFGGWDPGTPGSGGEFLQDIWKLDISPSSNDNKKVHWTKLDNIQLPYPVSRHGACTVDSGRMIVIHTYQGILVFRRRDQGGTGTTSTTGRLETVTVQETTGDGPNGDSMCAQAPLGNDGLIIFGGSTKRQELSNDVYYLDTTSWHWTKLKIVGSAADDDDTSTPSPRASPCAAPVIGSTNQVIVFGGASIGEDGYSGGRGLTPLNDTWLLTVNIEDGTAEWEKICVSHHDDDKSEGTAAQPEARLAATLTNIDGQRMILQGGYDSTSKQTFDETWMLENQ